MRPDDAVEECAKPTWTRAPRPEQHHRLGALREARTESSSRRTRCYASQRPIYRSLLTTVQSQASFGVMALALPPAGAHPDRGTVGPVDV